MCKEKKEEKREEVFIFERSFLQHEDGGRRRRKLKKEVLLFSRIIHARDLNQQTFDIERRKQRWNKARLELGEKRQEWHSDTHRHRHLNEKKREENKSSRKKNIRAVPAA